ncbi:hypothetical protein [Cyanobium sp. NS01]|uniref:hypothetical protein n=1 Tax=Cyanobium sp. NS01 TaxID=261284 RepID=UPI001644B807|nr:hypothetical protein [Cyanobium sp. NS01]
MIEMHAQHLVLPAGVSNGVQLGFSQFETHRGQSNLPTIGGTVGFPRFQGQFGKGHAITIRLAIDDQSSQNQTPVYGATEG